MNLKFLNENEIHELEALIKRMENLSQVNWIH